MIQLTTVWKDFPQNIYKYMALKIYSLKYFEPCTFCTSLLFGIFVDPNIYLKKMEKVEVKDYVEFQMISLLFKVD